jgi:hypothetical protein
MSRRLIVPGAAIAVAIAAIATFQPAHAAPSPRGAICEISGAAKISPGLTQTAKSQAVTLSGVKLTNCESGSAGSPGVPKKLSGVVTTSPNPVTTKASCASGNLALTASIAWSTGQTTVAKITTTGITANQAIKGNVTSSTNPSIKPGDLVAGDVAFRPTAPTMNCVKTPVTAVTFTGALGTGSPK